ncbi:MAG: hypothetical protein ACJ73E_14090 [Mycobacteriales bacterium]
MPPQPKRDDLEARLAAVEAALGQGEATLRPTPTVGGPRRIRDVVLRAASDPDFATELLANPDIVGAENGLEPAQVEKIRMLAGQGLLRNVLESRGAVPLRPVAEGGGGYY